MSLRAPTCLSLGLLLLSVLASGSAAPLPGLQRVAYNHPRLTVDLGVGLWAWPLPMDYDGDGDLDLVVSCPDTPSNGTYFFENPGGSVKDLVFKPAVRIGAGMANIQVSWGDGRGEPHVLTPGFEFVGFPGRGPVERKALPVPPEVRPTAGKPRAQQWKVCDYDGDGRLDLIVGMEDWADYGWDNAFNAQGEWTHGPLHGFVYLLRNTGSSEAPRCEAAVKVEAGGKPVDTFGMPSPSFADFDGDGDLDLLCGEFLDRLTYFENVGTRTAPRYAPGRFLSGDGRPLRMELCMIVPVAVDWDRDGDVDLVVGQEDGRVALLENTGRVVDGMPQFLPPRFFRQQADALKWGALATPCSFDWDGDGDEDLLCGDSAGFISFIENLDGGNPPRWAVPVRLEVGGQVIRIQAGPNGSIQGPAEAKWGYTNLSVADWDQDGLPDIVANSIWGEVIWYRNGGTRRAPKLAAAQPIEVEWPGAPPKPAWNWWNPKGKQLVTQWRTSPVVIDLNRDGLNDLVMLDPEGYLAFFERRREGGALRLLPGRRIFLGEDGQPLRPNAKSAGGSGRRTLVIADWDRDGRLDILMDGRNVEFWRNVGTGDAWVFRNQGAVDGRVLAGHSTRPTLVDWDRNGTPDLLVGAEDGCFYSLQNPYPIARQPRGAPPAHLVAAWDFEAGNGGPLADKATAGASPDTLVALGAASVSDGVGRVPPQAGAAFRAPGSPDLMPAEELTLWARVRVTKKPTGIVSLVDQRRFRDPEERSYGLYLTPGPADPAQYSIGGQVSADGTAAHAAAGSFTGKGIPAGEWRELAMVVERAGEQLTLRWYASANADPAGAGDLLLVNGPVSKPDVDRLFRSARDLLLGRDVNLGPASTAIELDEVRLYDRALTPAELAAILPAELSKGR